MGSYFFEMVSLSHPVQYQGSKRNLASDILKFLPVKIDRLVESFVGTAAVSIAVASKHINRRGVAFVISYDGKRGDKIFGIPLPQELGLKQIEIEVGRSSQATLLGRAEITVESLCLSPNLSHGHFSELGSYISKAPKQLTLLERHGRFSAVAR